MVQWPGKPCTRNQSIATSNQQEKYPQDRARAREDDRSTGSLTETTTPRLRTDTSNNGDSVCSCGKVLKNKRGLNIHRARMRCPPIVNLEQRARQLGETSEGPHPEAHHSVRPIPVPRDHEAAREQQRANIEQEKRKERINWPTQREKDR